MKCFLFLFFSLCSVGRFFDGALKHVHAENPEDPIPEKAPPELVLLVAKQSLLSGPGNYTEPDSDIDRKKILRTGDYWNAVWKDEVIGKTAMRSSSTPEKTLGSIKVKIQPGTEFYEVVSRLKKISNRLLYIVNKE